MDRGNEGRQAGTDQQPGWTFSANGSNVPQSPSVTPPQAGADSVEWTASEYIAHEKSASWYVQVFLATAIVAGFAYLVTRDMVSTVVLIFAGVTFAVAAARKPRVLAYRVDPGGLTVGQKYFPFGQFKSYALLSSGPITTVMLMPMKRFAPSVDIHLPPDNARAIVEVIANSLPIVDHKQGLVDTFTNRIRF